MIYNRDGDKIILNGIPWTVGMSIQATDESDYAGLYGRITEIRTDGDRETENDTPDIYCQFDFPVLPCEVKRLEEHFSMLYGSPKKLDELTFDMVIMAPEMLTPLDELYRDRTHLTIYAVVEDWAVNEESGHNEELFSARNDAIRVFHERLTEEQSNGCIPNWQANDSFCTDSGDSLYECWIDGEYLCNHYKISVEEKLVLCDASVTMREAEYK